MNRSFERSASASALLPRAPEILIVEDSSDLAIGLLNALDNWKIESAEGRCRAHIATDIGRAIAFLEDDKIDVYVVDLILDESHPDPAVGAELVSRINSQTKAGIIVLTSLSESDAAASELLRRGADDYIRKPADLDYVRARIEALWRRIQYVRPATRDLHTHNNREFLIGNWRFHIGNRILSNAAGDTLKLSPTEHAFLRYLCVNENHECDVVTFNTEVLGRKSHEENMRVDNLVYRLRNKFGEDLELLANEGKYRLLQVREITDSLNSATSFTSLKTGARQGSGLRSKRNTGD